MKLYSRKFLSVAFGVALVILVSVGWMSYRTTTRLIEDTAWVTHTHEVLGSLKEVLSQMKDTETGQRGYLITVQDKYLEPYQQALARVHQSIADLRQLTADNPRQQQQLDVLYPLVEEKLDELKETIDLRREKGFGAAATVVLTERGKKVMDEVRHVVAVMENEERRLLAERDSQARKLTQMTTRTLLIGEVLSFALLLFVFYLLNREIGQRMRAEEALRESEERFDRAIKSSNVGFWERDLETNQQWWSPKTFQMIGYEEGEIEPNTDKFEDFIHPNDREAVFEAVSLQLEKRLPLSMEFRMRTKSGGYRWFLSEGQAFRDNSGKPLRLAGSAQDITERKKAEEALKESEEQFR